MDLFLKHRDPSKVLLYPFQETSLLKGFILCILVTSLSVAVTIELRSLILKILTSQKRKKSIKLLINKYKNNKYIDKSIDFNNKDLITDLLYLILKDDTPNIFIKILISFIIAFISGFIAYWLIHILFGWGKETTVLYNNIPKSILFNNLKNKL